MSGHAATLFTNSLIKSDKVDNILHFLDTRSKVVEGAAEFAKVCIPNYVELLNSKILVSKHDPISFFTADFMLRIFVPLTVARTFEEKHRQIAIKLSLPELKSDVPNPDKSIDYAYYASYATYLYAMKHVNKAIKSVASHHDESIDSNQSSIEKYVNGSNGGESSKEEFVCATELVHNNWIAAARIVKTTNSSWKDLCHSSYLYSLLSTLKTEDSHSEAHGDEVHEPAAKKHKVEIEEHHDEHAKEHSAERSLEEHSTEEHVMDHSAAHTHEHAIVHHEIHNDNHQDVHHVSEETSEHILLPVVDVAVEAIEDSAPTATHHEEEVFVTKEHSAEQLTEYLAEHLTEIAEHVNEITEHSAEHSTEHLIEHLTEHLKEHAKECIVEHLHHTEHEEVVVAVSVHPEEHAVAHCCAEHHAEGVSDHHHHAVQHSTETDKKDEPHAAEHVEHHHTAVDHEHTMNEAEEWCQ